MRENLKMEGLTMFAKAWELIKTSIKVGFAYPVEAWGAFVVTLFQIFVFYYIWMAIYKFDSIINDVSKDQIVTYLILSRIIYTQITYGFIPRIGRMIHSGSISMELLRPMNFMNMVSLQRAGDFIAFSTMTAIPTLIICSLTLGMQLPKSLCAGVCFILSLVMALAISFFFDFVVGLMTFYTNYSWGLQAFQESFIALFSGALIPITFFPGWLKVLTNFLPFQQMSYTPVSIYLGIVKGPQIYEVLLTQVMWLVIMYFFAKAFFSFAIKKVTIQGG